MELKKLLFLALIWIAACSRGENRQPATDSVMSTTQADTTAPSPNADLIRVTQPHGNALVTSPLTISGEARGTWYFEASFPVILITTSGDTLAIKPAQAQGEWMTENFVPFTLTLTFAAPASPTGTLILKKDNPSGLPEHDAEIRIPVRFAP